MLTRIISKQRTTTFIPILGNTTMVLLVSMETEICLQIRNNIMLGLGIGILCSNWENRVSVLRFQIDTGHPECIISVVG